jgi:general secretion pathway protein A
MFLEFYGLREQPFGVTPDPRFLYISSTHREALASLYYGLETSRGFLTLIAPPGMGKTTLLFHLLERLRSTAHTAFLFQTQCDSRELFRYLLSDLGIDAGDQNLARMHEKLNEVLINDARAGKRFILVIDEAQNLEDSVLETVRLLSDFETPQAKLMQIVLAGQPQLADKLSRPGLAQLRQRISIVSRLEPFTPAETVMYIDHRLAVAGHNGDPLFTYDALALIAVQSGGIPRNINNLCFNALSLGFAKGQKRIDAATVREILSDLSLDLLGSLRDAARYVTPIPSPAAEVNWKADLVDREVQAAARAVRELRASPPAEIPSADPLPGQTNPRASEKHTKARLETARPAIGKAEIPQSVENVCLEEMEIVPQEERHLAIAALESDSKMEPAGKEAKSKTSTDSGEIEAATQDAKESRPNSHKRASSRPEAQKKESEVARVTFPNEPASTAAPWQMALRGHGKESANHSTGQKSNPASGSAEKEFPASLPQEEVVHAGRVQPATPSSSVSIFQKSGQVWRRIFRKGAFSYGLVVLLALAFLWPNRHLTPVRATPATEPVTLPQELAVTTEATNSKPAEKAPVTVVVKPAETLSGLMKSHIGTYDEKALAEIQALNPAIKDPNLIVVGQRIQLPHAARETNEANAPAADQPGPR